MRTEVSNKGISVSVVCPGPVYTEIIKRPVTEDQRGFQQKFWETSPMIMSSDRCARLLLVAGANRFAEVYVAKAPQVLLARMFEHLGGYLRPLMAFFATERLMKAYENGVLEAPKKD